MFPIFEPDEAGTDYPTAEARLLHRMRNWTALFEEGVPADRLAEMAADPVFCPFRLFTIPGESPKRWLPLLRTEALRKRPIDVVMIDLTRRGRDALGVDWGKRLTTFLDHLDANVVVAPPTLVITESPFVAKTAREIVSNRLRARRRGATAAERSPARLIGVLTEDGATLGGSESQSTSPLHPLNVSVYLKDVSLMALRDMTLGAVRELQEYGSDGLQASSHVRRAYGFVRRAVGLPCGLRAAQMVLRRDRANEEGEIPETLASQYFEAKVLADLSDAAARVPAFAQQILAYGELIRRFLADLQTSTPISRTLDKLLEELTRKSTKSIIVLPSAEAVEFLEARLAADRNGQDLSLRMEDKVQIVSRHLLGDALRQAAQRSSGVKRVALVQPRLEEVRKVLLMPDTDATFLLLDDAAGIGLVAADLAGITGVPGLERVAERVRSLLDQISDRQDQLPDPSLEIDVPLPISRTLDFTRDEGQRYDGPIVELTVSSSFKVRYRPNSDALLLTDDDLQPFRRCHASEVEVGSRMLVLSPPLMERLRKTFARRGNTSAVLRLYHDEVASARERIPGRSRTEKARHVLNMLLRADGARFTDSDLDNVRRWLAVDPTADDGVPNAPRDLTRYRAFAKAIGIQPALIDTLWRDGIHISRRFNISEGLGFHRRYVHFLMDPDTTLAKAAGQEEELAALWRDVLDDVSLVVGSRIIEPKKGGIKS
ncbi:hypothetical protein TSO221_31575 [Azospirillum sp. TSO22-1]|nr:hypothetical protein TSO221_31575 [Azospirillum sp. TSO22-1]